MPDFLKVLRDLVTPICLLVLAFFARSYVDHIEAINTPFIQNMPLILLGMAMILCWKFNRQQCFYLLFMTFAYMAALTYFVEQPLNLENTTTSIIVSAFAIFLPANLILFSIWRAPKSLSISRFAHLLILAAEILLVYWIIKEENTSIFAYTQAQFLPQPITLLAEHIPQTAVALFIGIIIFLGVSISLKQDAVDCAVLVSIISLFLTINFIHLAHIHLFVISAVALMVCIAIVQESFNMAFVDPLTRLPSRRAMNEELDKLGKKYCIAMLDIDHFKRVNDKYGHDVGDQVLKKVAKHLQRVTGGGKAARYGGEEFAIIFSGKSISEVTHHLDELRQNIANSFFAIRKKPRPKKIPKATPKPKSPNREIKVTVSIGIAERNRMHRKIEDVQKAADEALYKAKKTGRNKICY